jgi:hypothetical protein
VRLLFVVDAGFENGFVKIGLCVMRAVMRDEAKTANVNEREMEPNRVLPGRESAVS